MRPEATDGRAKADRPAEKETASRPEMTERRQVVLEDGRYLIYYTFEDKQPPRRSR